MTNTQDTAEVELRIGHLLRRMGISPSLSGYDYLKTGIAKVYASPNNIHCVTKILYPTIATQHHTTATCVERAIRHAVDSVYLNGDTNFINKIVFCPKDKFKATNTAFIASIAEYFRTF